MILLTLKFVIHFGTISEIKVARFEKASGLDMVIAHRLLKNNITSHEYLLMTKNYLTNIPDADEAVELSWNVSTEDYSSIGTVEFQFALLDPVKKRIPEIPKQQNDVPDDGSPGVYIEIDANFKEVYQVVMDPAMIKYYGGEVRDVVSDDPVPRIGSKHYCIFDDFKVEFEPMNLEVTEHEIKLAEYQRIPEMNFYAVVEYTLIDLGPKRCKVIYHVFPEEGHVIPQEIKMHLTELSKVAMNNLKTFVESGEYQNVNAGK